jgi:hypothetical protein
MMMLRMPSRSTGALSLEDVQDEAGDVLFLLEVHTGHGLI